MTRFKTIYVQQDGADFYIYYDSECLELRQTVTAPLSVGFNLNLALKARQWFETFFSEAGLKIIWHNPFKSTKPAKRVNSSHNDSGYTGKPAGPRTRMIDMSAYRGDDLEF